MRIMLKANVAAAFLFERDVLVFSQARGMEGTAILNLVIF